MWRQRVMSRSLRRVEGVTVALASPSLLTTVPRWLLIRQRQHDGFQELECIQSRNTDPQAVHKDRVFRVADTYRVCHLHWCTNVCHGKKYAGLSIM